MLKCYEAYLNSISNLSPKTIERIDYIYNSFEFVINTTKTMFNFLYYKNDEIKRIEYLPEMALLKTQNLPQTHLPFRVIYLTFS